MVNTSKAPGKASLICIINAYECPCVCLLLFHTKLMDEFEFLECNVVSFSFLITNNT